MGAPESARDARAGPWQRARGSRARAHRRHVQDEDRGRLGEGDLGLLADHDAVRKLGLDDALDGGSASIGVVSSSIE